MPGNHPFELSDTPSQNSDRKQSKGDINDFAVRYSRGDSTEIHFLNNEEPYLSNTLVSNFLKRSNEGEIDRYSTPKDISLAIKEDPTDRSDSTP